MWHFSERLMKQKEFLSGFYLQPKLGSLIKFKQTTILVFTGAITYLISSWQSSAPIINFVIFLVGIFFAVSGSTILNMYYDRDLDAKMPRTKTRPLPSGMVNESYVLIFGIFMSTMGIAIVGLDNIETSIIVLAGIFIDTVIYSILLKRKTKYSIFLGGIAGGLPAIAGRVAFTNNLDIISILLGLLVITWVPIHVLTLALIPRNLEGYRNAQVPMWPVVSSIEETCRIIALSAIGTTLSFLLCSIFLKDNLIICLPMILFGIGLIIISVYNLIKPSRELAFKTFKIASIFLIGAFCSLIVGIII